MRKRHLEILGYHVLQVSKDRIVPLLIFCYKRRKLIDSWIAVQHRFLTLNGIRWSSQHLTPGRNIWERSYFWNGTESRKMKSEHFLVIPKMHSSLDIHPGVCLSNSVTIDGLHIMCKDPIPLFILTTRLQRNTTLTVIPHECLYICIFCNINIIAVTQYLMSYPVKSHSVMWTNILNEYMI